MLYRGASQVEYKKYATNSSSNSAVQRAQYDLGQMSHPMLTEQESLNEALQIVNSESSSKIQKLQALLKKAGAQEEEEKEQTKTL
jgi:hypothetical protein